VITCEQCLYWEPPEEGSRLGLCRREAPRERWPFTLAIDWCGQATQRECGSTQPVHEAAQAVVDWWYDVGNRKTHDPMVMANLREALRRMKP